MRRAAALAFSLCALPAAAAAEGYAEVRSPRGVTVPVWHGAPAAPWAAAVLLPGGGGALELEPGGIGRMRANTVVRARGLLAGAGIAFAIPDAPSDRGDLANFRLTARHAADLGAVVAWLRERHPGIPVWMIGISRGAISAAAAAARLGPPPTGPDGVVLLAAVTGATSWGGDTVLDAALDRIRVPALVVHHARDGCEVSPLPGARTVLRRLRHAPRRELIVLRGGDDEDVNPCRARTHHGFLGLERELVRRVAAWMRAAAGAQ